VPVIRKLPRAQYTGNMDWYPPKAKQNHVTGRVLVGFVIDANGRATSVKILKSEAPRSLRDAALDFVRDMRFDVTDPNYSAADPTPFALSVRFCIIDCGSILGYAGYDDVRISGSPVSPLG
jgi:TonB family protein